jgi:transposase
MLVGMIDYRLGQSELAQLRAEHRRTRDKRAAYRLNVVILLGSGWSAEQVAEALLIEADSARSYFKRYQEGGIEHLVHMAYSGGEAWLDASELALLDAHLQCTLYLTAKEVAHWVEQHFGVRYSESGMTALLHRLGYVYKKPKLVPGKADAGAQRAFLEDYARLKERQGPNDALYFVDAVHPQHNPVLGYGWIKRGEERAIPSNTGRRRLNINGAIDLKRLAPLVRFDDTINAASTVALFRQLEEANPQAERILVICDNASYYRSKEVREFTENSRIELVFLPPYSPNLNLIERFWKFFKKRILYDTYYESFKDFQQACERFFRNASAYAAQLRSLLTENFQILGN